jgi:hypothetical protein
MMLPLAPAEKLAIDHAPSAHPIMFNLKSYRLVEYRDKLYEWAREPAAGAGPD